MKHKEPVEIPARMEIRVVRTTCDICGVEVDRNAWDYKHREVSCEVGESYPEGTWFTRTSFDLCVECFKTKLQPFLESLGAKPSTEEINF